MRQSHDHVSVFQYKDYRVFLKDWYQRAKESGNSFSFRAFSRRAGFHSSNFLMLVIQGKRNLTEASLKKFAAGLKLNKQEQEFFRNLVFFNQAKNQEDGLFYYQRLLQSKKFRQMKPIEIQHYDYYSAWYHPVVRELVASKEFDGTPEWIAQRLEPSITPAQAAHSIQLLESLGFIKKSGGRWRQTSSVITTGPTVTSLVIHNYHKEVLDLTKELMDRLPVECREVATLTLGIKKERFEELKTKIREFRQEVLKLVSGDTEPEEVAQLNIQFFPVATGNGKPKDRRSL